MGEGEGSVVLERYKERTVGLLIGEAHFIMLFKFMRFWLLAMRDLDARGTV